MEIGGCCKRYYLSELENLILISCVVSFKFCQDLAFNEVMPSLDRGSSQSVGWRRSRFSRMTRRNNSHISPRSNSLLHARHLGIQRRKPSLLNRIFHGRTLQNQMRSLSTHHSTSEATAPVNLETGQRSGDQVTFSDYNEIVVD
jgi:hypothetical protein